MTVLLAYATHPRGIDKPRTSGARLIFCLVALTTLLTGRSPADQTGTPVAAGTDQATTPRFSGTTLKIAQQVLFGEPEKNAALRVFRRPAYTHRLFF